MKPISGMIVMFLLAVFARGPVHAMSPGDSEVKALLMKLEREWDDATVAKNASVVERILADDWTYWDTQSRFKTKTQELAEIKGRSEECEPMVLDDLSVRVYGNAAVVTGREAGRCRDVKAGSVEAFHQRFTDTFIKRRGRWQCVATHESPISEDKRQLAAAK
jgi:ketosteroid isomerase-like protein